MSTPPDGPIPEASPAPPPWAQLRGRIVGPVTLPGDAAFEASRTPWHVGLDQRPLAVVHVASAADVQLVVRFAATYGLAVSPQPRGHGATTAVDGTVLLRTSALDELSVDPERRTARVGAGVSWGRLQGALDGTGLTALTGSHPGVTAVPAVLGGGLSWFSRAYGTGAASLRAADVVGADGSFRRVDGETDADLLWALRGGGGDFGVVTAVELDLHPAPVIYGGRVALPGSAAGDVLRAYADVTAGAPDTLTLTVQLMHHPPGRDVPDEVRGRSFVMVDAVMIGTADDAEPFLAPLRSAGPVLRETVRRLEPGQVGSVAEEPDEGMAVVVRTQPLRAFDAGTVQHLLDHAGADSGVTTVAVRHLGGALATADRREGAAVRVEAQYMLVVVAAIPSPERRASARAAVDRVVDALRPWHGHGSVLNFLGDTAPVEAAYGATTLDRLREVKRSVDPAGVFRSNHPVLGTRGPGDGA